MPCMDPLHVRDLSLNLSGKTIFQNLDLPLRQCGFHSLIGLSGVGKTQLVRTLAGLQDGVLSPFLDLKVRVAFQENLLIPWVSVQKNLEICTGAPKSQIDQWLQKVGLRDARDLLPSQLSGGMQQKVSLLRAFHSGGEVLLLDEPFVKLDHSNKNELYRALIQMWVEQRPTILFVTHDIREALRLSERVFFFSKREKAISQVIDIDAAYPRDEVQVETDHTFITNFKKIKDLLEEDFRG